MPLQLNLLHEEILEQRQRQRDPLKLSIYAGIGLAALLLLNYLWTGYRVLDSKRHLSGVQGEWTKVEPKVTAAQKRAEELKGITITLDGVAGGREPRGVAEDFRQMLLEQIGKGEPSVKVEFKTLEDLDM